MANFKSLMPISTLVRKVGERASVGKPFYSPIDQAIANITQGTGTGQQMLAELLKTKGVAKELKDRPAIKKALEGAKDTNVTKADVERVAAENPTPQVQHRESDTTEYEQWQMPGGENHRNILLRLPNPAAERNAQIAAQIRDLYQGIGWSNQHMAKFPHLSVDEIPRIAHSEQVIAKLRKELAALPRTPDMYESGHFDEKNILAHARVADYYDNNGKKILLIDEIQSDWHQTARDARKNEIKRLMKAEGIDKATANERVPKEFGYAMPETQRLKGVAQPDDQGGYKVVWEDGTFSGGYSKEGAEAKALEGKSNATSGVVPDAPFKQNWHELVMKRLLDDAARNGYDKVVITPGAEQAKRYDLSKQISRVVYSPTTETLNAFDNSGKSVLMKSGITPERVEDYIGEEPAKRLLDPQNTKSYLRGGKEDSYHEITGEDLRVGGEGMTGFYDQILPSYLNDYGKKYGARVGTYEMPVGEKMVPDRAGLGMIRSGEQQMVPFHSFDITPQMREEITFKGQPLYQVAPPVAIGAGAAMQEEEPTEYAGGGIIKKAGQIIGKAAQNSGMARPVTATKDLTTLQDFHTSLGDRIRQSAGEKQNLIESTPFKYNKGQRVFTEDSARKNRLPYEILDRTLYGNQPMRADHPVLGPGMGAVIKDPDTGKSMRTPYEAGYRVRSEGPEGWQEYVLPETAIKGDVEMAGGGAVRKALKAVLPKGQQAILPAAESAANLERFLAESAVKDRMYHGTFRGGFSTFDRNKTTEWRQPSMDTVGSWFSNNPSEAGGAGMYASGQGASIYPVHLSIKNPKEYNTFNDFLVDMHSAAGRELPKSAPGLGSTEELRQKLKAEGYDGIAFKQTANQSLMQDIQEMQDAVKRARMEELSMKRQEREPYTMKRERLEQTLNSMNKELSQYGSSTEFDEQRVFIPLEPTQIKSAIGNRGTYDPAEADINKAKGGQVTNDAMWIALQNKQLRKKHGN